MDEVDACGGCEIETMDEAHMSRRAFDSTGLRVNSTS
jgi:hypothetical protein